MQLIAVFAVQSCRSGVELFGMAGSGSVCLRFRWSRAVQAASMALSLCVL